MPPAEAVFRPLDAMDSCDVSDCGFQRLASDHVAQLRSLSRSKASISSASGDPSPEENKEDSDNESRSFVDRQLAATTPLPPITWTTLFGRIIWFNLITVTLTPLLSLYGIFTTRATPPTVVFSIVYYVWNMLGRSCPGVKSTMNVEI